MRTRMLLFPRRIRRPWKWPPSPTRCGNGSIRWS
jgi:hypothetical protein